MRDVTVIKPNSSVGQILDRNNISIDDDAVKVLGYPKFLYESDIEIERKLFRNRKTTMSVTVDLLTGNCRKNDVYPELASHSLIPASLLNPRLEKENAAETAHSYIRRHVNGWYKTFKTPRIAPTREDSVFKLFWIIPSSTASTVDVIDTITGQITIRDVEIGELTPNSPNE